MNGRFARRSCASIVGLLCCLPAPVHAQVLFDFESGLGGWTATGDAFQQQPLETGTPQTTDFAGIRLGGSYWHSLPYPLGQSGRHVVRSSDAGTGTLTSGEFTPSATARYLSLLLGGGRDINRVRVEVWSGGQTIWQAAGYGPDQLHLEVFEIPAALRGQAVQVRLVDDSPTAHILLDRVAVHETPPPAPKLTAWGLADYHTHPMNYMAFGALNGVRTVWGVPGGAYDDYERNPRLIERDIPPCVKGHGGGPSAETFINSAEGAFAPGKTLGEQIGALFKGIFFPGFFRKHPRSGAPHFDDFPGFRHGLHYQMHITQIRRAWEGGLRLMTAIAVHNKGVEFVMSKLENGETHPSSERAVLDAQVCGMRDLARLNHDWMEIAYSPAQARDIVAHGKLAIVLAVEMDQLGQLEGFAHVDDEVQYLWDLGIRQVTPVHAADNRLGAAAVFEPVYNSLNDLLNRGRFNARKDDLPAPVFFDVENGGCGRPGDPSPGECVTYSFDHEQSRGYIMRSPATFFRLAPFLADAEPRVPEYGAFRGMLNRKGLNADGASYLRGLMRRGMLVGLEHMSSHTVDDVYGLVGRIIEESGHPECRTLTPESTDDCFTRAYPLVVSHAHLRRLSPEQNEIAGYRASEYEVSDRQAAMVRKTGGLIGQFVAEDPVVFPKDLHLPGPAFANDCGGSSKSFGYSLAYAQHLLGGRGVGLATDFTIITGTAPRFGREACWGDRETLTPGKTPPIPGQYETAAQRQPVVYDGSTLTSPSGTSPLKPYRMGTRTYDFNVDGLANYGLVPDLLQDLTNLGWSPPSRASLFRSVEDFLVTWEKAEGLSGGYGAGTFVPKTIACETICRGLCPSSPRAGAPGR